MGLLDGFKRKEKRSGEFNYNSYLNSLNFSGHELTEAEAFSVAAFDGGIQLLSDAASNFPLQCFRGTQKQELPIILKQPYEYETLKVTLQSWYVDYLLMGNAFGIPVAVGGEYVEIVPVNTEDVSCITDGVSHAWKIKDTVYAPHEIFHVPNIKRSGEFIGRGVLKRAAHTLRHAVTADDFSRNQLTEGGTPPYALSTPAKMTKEEKDEMRDGFMAARSRGRRVPAILDNDLKLQEYGFNNQVLQLLEARHFDIISIANHLRVHSSFLNWVDGNSYTYTNMEMIGTMLDYYSLLGHIRKFEAELTRFLPPDLRAQFNMDGDLRVDSKTRADNLTKYVDSKIMTDDEAREKLDLPKLTPKQREQMKPTPPPVPIVAPVDNSNKDVTT